MDHDYNGVRYSCQAVRKVCIIAVQLPIKIEGSYLTILSHIPAEVKGVVSTFHYRDYVRTS